MSPVLSLPRPLLDIENLRVRFGEGRPVVKGLSLQINRGERLAIIGESGSGKSVTSRSLVGLTGSGAQVTADRFHLDGEDLRGAGERHWRRIRGARIGFVMQDALGSLDPLRTIGAEIAEGLRLHLKQTREAREAKVIDLLRSVGVPEPELRAQQYPRQLSGGLRQRALIASAIACAPELLIADEPTTALDAGVQAQVLRLLESLQTSQTAMLIISHDFAVVSRLADRIAVMHRGEIVEHGPAQAVLESPQHPHTQELLAAALALHPAPRRAGPVLAVIPRAPAAEPAPSTAPVLIEADHLSKTFKGPRASRRSVVSDVSFVLRQGETLGVVGESGSGKTTLARLVLGLERQDSGVVRFRGRDWNDLGEAERRAERRRIQVVFQDPLGSFDPRYTVERVLNEALDVAGAGRGEARRLRAIELLRLVQLDASLLTRRPIELSGGQRQRVAIARALAPRPQVLICDEPVSSLDVSVQARILDLLDDLKTRLGLSCIFISHDLGVINRVSDRLLVMKDGVIVEQGAVRDVLDRPQNAYTRELLNALPQLAAQVRVRHA